MVSEGGASLTRWLFEDFKLAYDSKFGRKDGENRPARMGNAQSGGALSNGSSESNGSGESNGSVKRGRELAPYEKFAASQGRERGGGGGGGGDAGVPNGGVSLSAGVPKEMPGWMKPLPEFPTLETTVLAESIMQDIVKGDLNVQWDSIQGLENAKRLLKEAVVMPIKYPQYFTGLLTPWKGILLFGPPGTGKTMLAKAVATECKTTFFNISASSIVSKWRGDGEKLVKVLFELARHFAPSTIFFDEIDSLISTRGEGSSEHEASRRLKTELLVQMDGLTKTKELVFVLAATNLPWQLDSAMLRRLEKRILVPLPEPEAREGMFQSLLGSQKNGLEELPLATMVEGTEGYSGSDIRIVCKEAAMRPLRRVMAILEKRDPDCEDPLPELGPITTDDILISLKTTRPSAHLSAAKYTKFDNDYGSQTLQSM
ncbi:hypothetical protein KC19_2G139500 [Ceratodon purpureus]|uniref:AAA+ ATPase domain-containing protein n=1 Tax=Ceratodon purpureus TaxID=3225 RepID=A0A8T0IV84_CERPU|nr:hypothetical protein KC19_2G139500 [Ceratodon purpureus]